MSSNKNGFVELLCVLTHFCYKTKIQWKCAQSDKIQTQKIYRQSLILFEFCNEWDFEWASSGKWYWTISARSHTLANTWLGTGERKPHFWVANPHAHKPLEMNINYWIKDHTDQRWACRGPNGIVGKIQ